MLSKPLIFLYFSKHFGYEIGGNIIDALRFFEPPGEKNEGSMVTVLGGSGKL